MRKIYHHLENPIDHIILNNCDKLIPHCNNYNITPNMITIFRFILGVYILYYLYLTDDIIFTVIGSCVFYFLDCLDGHLARSTNQVTQLGDYLDHSADIFIIGGLILYCLINSSNKILVGTLIFSSLYLTLIHLGLQQKHYNDHYNKLHGFYPPYEILEEFNCLHNLDNHHIMWTRFFGNGTFIMLIIYSVYIIKSNIQL